MRTASWLLGSLVLLLSLTGCFQLRQDLRVEADHTVSGTIRLGVDRRLLDRGSGGAEAELVLGSIGAGPEVPGVTVSTYTDRGYSGREVRLERVSVDDVTTGSDGGLVLETTGDGLRVRMRSLAARAAVGFDEADDTPPDLEADVHLAVTFPGRVLAHNGTSVQGSTVIWQYRTVAEAEAAPPMLEAEWDDSGLVPGSLGTGSGGLPWQILGLAGLAVAVSVGAGVAVVRRRRAMSPATIWLDRGHPGPAVPAEGPGRRVPLLALGPGPSAEAEVDRSTSGRRSGRTWPPPPTHRQRPGPPERP